jgi:hypothetical protein
LEIFLSKYSSAAKSSVAKAVALELSTPFAASSNKQGGGAVFKSAYIPSEKNKTQNFKEANIVCVIQLLKKSVVVGVIVLDLSNIVLKHQDRL